MQKKVGGTRMTQEERDGAVKLREERKRSVNTLTEVIMEMKNDFLSAYNQPPNRILIPVKVRDRLEGEIRIDVEDGDVFADMNLFIHDEPYITIDDGYHVRTSYIGIR
jgi:hypothetical protein